MPNVVQNEAAPRGQEILNRRWLQLTIGVIAMMAISSPQYVWTLFVKPLQTTMNSSLAAMQVTFSVLIVVQTWLSPLQGFWIERFGVRTLFSIGAVLVGASWILGAYASTPVQLYATYGLLGGLGTGIIYIGIVGLMVKWFPDRRGFATGMVAAGYGFGAIVFTFPVDSSIKASGYATTLITFGFVFGAILLITAQLLRRPPLGWQPPRPVAMRAAVAQTGRQFSPKAMLRTPIFWLMFVMMTMMSTGGLMVTSQISVFAREFGVAQVLVYGLAALPLALTVDRVLNGVTRPFFGWVSDRIGRENTMALAFLLEAAAVFLLLAFRADALAFVLLSGLVFFGWGEIFSLFPSTLTDTYGEQHATTNYGFLYIAQGVGSVLGGPVAALLHDQLGTWVPVFYIVITLDILTALLALLVLKPMRRRWFGGSGAATSQRSYAGAGAG
jgi:MFS transporter, OFA family, oxalate/formate antiporter